MIWFGPEAVTDARGYTVVTFALSCAHTRNRRLYREIESVSVRQSVRDE